MRKLGLRIEICRWVLLQRAWVWSLGNANHCVDIGHCAFLEAPPLDFCSVPFFTKFVRIDARHYFESEKNTLRNAVNSNWLERKHLLAAVQKWPYGEQAELLCPPLLVACTPTTIMSTKNLCAHSIAHHAKHIKTVLTSLFIYIMCSAWRNVRTTLCPP